MEKEIKQEFKKVRNRIDKLENRIDILEQHMTQEFRGVNTRLDETTGKLDELFTHIDGFMKITEKIDHEQAVIGLHANRLAERVTAVEARVAKLETMK